MNDLKKRNIGIDFIKIIACIGVVLLHAIGFKASKFNNLLYYLGTISIPLFFMTNGFFILNKDNINIKYLLKKISKFLDIIIFFNVIYWVTTLLIKRSANNIVIQVLKSIIGKGKIYWLWFLSSLIILYIICPILKKILDNNKINR